VCSLQQRTKGLSNPSELLNKTRTTGSEMASDPLNEPSMHTPQIGIFALGTSSHVYLEFDFTDDEKFRELASALA